MVIAVLESFPTLSYCSTLTVKDFSRFSKSYSEILQRYIPAVQRVEFVSSKIEAETCFRVYKTPSDLNALYLQVKGDNESCGIHPDVLMLAFDVQGSDKVVAIMFGADPFFLKNVDTVWFSGIKTAIHREFLLLKQARVDSQTDLLNISNLYSLLDTYGSCEGVLLVLVELPPKRTSYQHILRHLQKCANLLKHFIHSNSVLHSLGASTFAILIQQDSREECPGIEAALVSYLKRAGLHKVHIGSSSSGNFHISGNETINGRLLLDEAWTALRRGALRGPYTFCDFGLLVHPEKHPLSAPDRNLMSRLNRLWSGSDFFCLVLFRSDNLTIPVVNRVLQCIDKEDTVSGDDEIFVYLERCEPANALKWAQGIIVKVCKDGQNIQISAGVSSYPYGNFKKTELIYNCRKALVHASFYGKASAALFDAVSLNISGDVYFGDGDLAKAVKEYHRGLQCDNKDVNLHNSLGVALAMMNKQTQALRSFENAFALDGNNFMALYNLGLCKQNQNRPAEALLYFEQALQQYSPEEAGVELMNDLTLQLGILCCELGKYDAALSYLVPWQQENAKSQSVGRVYYYLGAAYYGTKNNKQAMEVLQKALRFDELDDRAMQLLGVIYLEEGEGREIALSLCRKSVELEPLKIEYKLSLAKILFECGSFQESRDNLYRCIKNKNCKIEAQFLLGECYRAEGRNTMAKNWFVKVLKQVIRKDLMVRAKQRLKEIGKQ